MSHGDGKVMLSGPGDRERYQPSSAICTPAGPGPEPFRMSARASRPVDGWSSTAASSRRYLRRGGRGRRRPLCLPCEPALLSGSLRNATFARSRQELCFRLCLKLLIPRRASRSEAPFLLMVQVCGTFDLRFKSHIF